MIGLILMILIQIHFGLARLVPEFHPNSIKSFTNGTNLTSILIHDKYLYVGAKDYLYRFDASNVENTNEFSYIHLPTNYDQKEQCLMTYYDELMCNNYIKTIIYRKTDNDLYVCGTYAFTPRLFQVSLDMIVLKEDDGYGYCSLNPLDSSTSIWIEHGNPLNIPSLFSGSLLDASTKTQPVEPVIYRPELKRGDKVFPYLRTPKFDSDWLYQPNFIKSFEVDEYVIFFIRERSVEQLAEYQDMHYSRVIRVCKNDAGSLNLGNQWSSMRKARLACAYNNTYLNYLEDVIRISDEKFIGVFSHKLPTHSVSYLCEITKQSMLQALNSNSFKEVLPGTQFWWKLSSDRIPKSLPSQCDYNSQQLKDDVTNFIKSHSLVSDLVEAKFLHFSNRQITKIAVDTIKSADSGKINLFYLATNDGKIIKLVDSIQNGDLIEISVWKICDETIDELKVKEGQSLFMATNRAIYQVALGQCNQYTLCNMCMIDPYCGWNVRKSTCDDLKSSSNLIALNPNLCSRYHSKRESIKVIEAEVESDVFLDCELNNQNLLDYIEWKREKISLNEIKNQNLVITASKDLLILNGNSSQNGLYNCFVDNEIVASYNVEFKQGLSKNQLVSTNNQKCITAESYIRQYNNWCDEFSRYQRALNEWEELKEKTCGRN